MEGKERGAGDVRTIVVFDFRGFRVPPKEMSVMLRRDRPRIVYITVALLISPSSRQGTAACRTGRVGRMARSAYWARYIDADRDARRDCARASSVAGKRPEDKQKGNLRSYACSRYGTSQRKRPASSFLNKPSNITMKLTR